MQKEKEEKVAQNVTLDGSGVTAGVISPDEVILEWRGSLVQEAWCPFKKRTCEHTHTHSKNTM